MKRYFVRIANGSKSNGLLGLSCVDHEVALSSSRLSAPRISLSGHGSGLMPAPRSTRKFWIVGFDFGSTMQRSSACSAMSKYASSSSGESCSVSWLFTNPSRETASGGSTSARSSSSSSSSRSVLRYWATVSRRTPPFFGVGRERADFSACVDPLDHPLALGGRRLRFVLRRHGLVRELLEDCLPQLQMPVFELRIEMIDADAGGQLLRVVAPHAVLLQERLHLEIERSAKRTLSLSSVHGGGCGLEQDHGGEWQAAEGANVLDAGTDHESDSSRSSG